MYTFLSASDGTWVYFVCAVLCECFVLAVWGMYMLVWVCMHIPSFGGQRSSVFFDLSPLYFLREFLNEPKAHWYDLSSLSQPPPMLGLQICAATHVHFFFSFTHLFNMNFEDTNLGLHVCVGGTLPMQSFPNSGPRLLYLRSNAFIFFSPTVTHYKYLLSKPPKDDKLELHLWIWSFILLMAHRAINDLIIFTSYNGNYPVKFQEKTAHTLSANKIGGNQKDFPKEY